MKIDKLVYFYAAAKFQNLHRASESLRISVSSITHAVQSLEHELQVELFMRIGRRIHLTPEGERAFSQVKNLLQGFDDLKNLFGKPQKLAGYFRIGCAPLLLERFILPKLKRLILEHPDVRLETCSLSSADVQRHLIDHRIDVGFCFSPQKNPNLENHFIYSGELKLAVSSKHPAARTTKPQQLSQYPCILPPSRTSVESCLEHPMFKKFGITPQPKMIFDSYTTAIKILTEDHQFWSLLPDIFLTGQKSVVAVNVPKKSWIAPYQIACLQCRDKRSPIFDYFSKSDWNFTKLKV